MDKILNRMHVGRRFRHRSMTGFLICMALATPATAVAAGGAGPVVIETISVVGGDIYVHAPGIANPDGCASSAYFVIRSTDVGRDLKYSLVLTAKVARTPITMWFEGCTASPWHASAPHLGAVDLK